MKKEILSKMFNRVAFLVIVSCALTMAGCSDDPESTNEEEVITTVIVTLTPPGGDGVVTLAWDDANLDAVVDESEITVSNSLEVSTSYTAVIQLSNEGTNITEEVQDEAEDHIFCFTVTGANIAVTNRNTDSNGLPLGITSTWTTTATQGSGTVNITLRHQPGVKTGDCPGAGDTDASITFPIEVGVPL